MSHSEEFITENINNASLEELMSFLADHIDSIFKTDKNKKRSNFKLTLRDSSHIAYEYGDSNSITKISHKIQIHNGRIKLTSSVDHSLKASFWIKAIVLGLMTAGVMFAVFILIALMFSNSVPIKQHIHSAQTMLKTHYGF